MSSLKNISASCELRTETKPPALTGSSGRRLQIFNLALLCLNDSRRDEEDQLLVRRIHLRMLEQVSQERDISQQRHLADIDRVLRLDHATDHHGTGIGHQY